MASGSSNTRDTETQLNYKEVKQNYLMLVRNNPHLLDGPLCTREAIDEVIKEIIDDPDGGATRELMIKTEKGKTKLFLRKKQLEILSVEDAFDAVLETHVECNHENATITFQVLKSKYVVPTFCVNWVIQSCNVCSPRAQKSSETERKLRLIKGGTRRGAWRMHIFKHPSLVENPHSRACYLLIYKENSTNFLLLRPLFESSEELALDIFKLFVEFGYPEKVIVPNMIQFYRNVFRLVFTMNPIIEVLVQEASKADIKDIFKDDQNEVLMELEKWKETSGNTYWDQGCHVVQYKMNKTEKYITSIGTEVKFLGIPFDLFFESRATVKNEVSTPEEGLKLLK